LHQFRQFVPGTQIASDAASLPRSLRSVADVRAARTKDKIGHSGRDDSLLGFLFSSNSFTLVPKPQLKKSDAWDQVEQRNLQPDCVQNKIGRVTFRELVENYRKKAFHKLGITTQAITAHILDHYLLPRWGENFALDIEPDQIEEWLEALELADPTKEKIRRVMNVVYRRGQKSGLLPRTGDGNPVAFVTQSSKSNYKAVIVSPEQAFRIMMELGEPYRTLVFLVAVTGLRISEALGLKWSDLDYERQMIHLRRVWVGNELVPHMKTDGSEAPVPLGELLADALQSWHRNTLYAKTDDWIFPSTKMKGRTPLSASMMAKDKIRPAALKAGIRLERGQRFGFHNFRHSLATFLINKGKDVKTIQGLLRHAKASTTLDLYSQAIDASKLAAQRDIALAITSNQAQVS
jgi:integrase